MDVEEKLANISIKEESPSRDISATLSNLSSARTGQSDNGSQRNSSRILSTESEPEKDPETKERFMRYVTKARQLTEAGDIARAIKLNEKALAIRFSDKLQKRIAKMKVFLAEQGKSDGEEEGEDRMKSLGQGFVLHHSLHNKLYAHQKEGVLWMWSLFLLGKGGILADDMGLGKTIQVIAFLAGMFDMNKIKSVMIVVPLSVMPSWLNEFKKWTPGINVMQFHGSSKKEKERALHRVRTRGGVLMTTYGLVITTKETFAERHGQEFVWDYVILDEGHKIKNPTKTSKSVHLIPARHRIILTGTPVQNNLKELWSLFDYVHQGSLLGTMRTFKMEFETPIIRARERDASAMEKQLGQEMAATLKSIIKPYFLRRTKAEVSDKNVGQQDTKTLKMPSMTRKNDLVIWLHLTETQQQIYQDFINLDHVKELLMTKKSPLVALTVLKKICDHPRLLSTRACLQLGLDGEDFDEEALEQPESYESAVTKIDEIPDEVLINESGKMQILVSLLDNFKQEGHQTLVFSQSRKLLNIIQKVITNRGHKVARMDGTITQLSERDEIVKKFQKDPSYSVFLLTVQVGGVGLTITAADRVIIYDPNWNPATDAQAVDRVYRIGQQKNVVVYRLITCGTVEEKIYRRQVFKDSITKQTTGSTTNPYRYFTKMELRELFTLDDPRFSKTQRQLQDLHGNQRQSDTQLDEHIAFLHSHDIFGISDHDLMFSQADVRDDEEDDMTGIGVEEEQNNARLIQHKIQTAQKLIAEESTIPSSYEERSKGVMRFPVSTATTYTAPTSGGPPHAGGIPRPSPLFTQVAPGESDPDVVEVGDDSSISVVTEVVDSSMASGDGSVHLEEINKQTPPANLASNPPANSSKERRALQPLSSEEVHQRSPQVMPTPKNREIVAEEILISPDNSSPIIGLEKVHAHRRMMEEAARAGSFPSSPIKTVPSSPQFCRVKGIMSPSKVTGSPMKIGLSPSKSGTPKRNWLSPGKSNLRKSLFSAGATSTPVTVHGTDRAEILVEESPDAQTPPPNSKRHFANLSSSHQSDPLDVSQACRKLSFVVADSTQNSPADADQSSIQNLKHSPCPIAKKKPKADFSPGVNLTPESHESRSAANSSSQDKDSHVSVSENSLSQNKLRNTSRSLLAALNESTRSSGVGEQPISSPSKSLISIGPTDVSPRKAAVTNRRRSVCLRKSVLDDESSDDSEEKKEAKGTSSDSEENDENENCDEDVIAEDEEEGDKENDPVYVKRVGGRNRLISESGSESGSCFEVEESEEEEAQSQEEVEEEVSSAGVEETSNGQDLPMEASKESESTENTEEDEELNQKFQNLIVVARGLYKEKNYGLSLAYVEEALQIFDEPALLEMADKIRLKIQQSLQ